ncbi:MAG: hypothetical protein KDD45_08575 [Bdellovibrionales bacterium]|nr:hypothetical protein [Bdellovibrionales bacterium]
MKHKIWNTKNSYGGRTFAGKEVAQGKDTCMMGQKVIIYAHQKRTFSTIDHCEDVGGQK